MGYWNDSDSESNNLDESMMSCSGVSFDVGRRRYPAGMDDSSKKHNFKFSWDDSGISSVCTADLDASEISFGGGGGIAKQKHERKRNSQLASPLDEILEQVDGVAYEDDDGLPELLLSSGDEGSSEKGNLPLPVQKTKSLVDDTAVVEPPEPQRECAIKFQEPLITHHLEYVQEEDAPLTVWDDGHVTEDHDQISWEDQDYEELPWHLVPDLDQDDELTKRCKEVISNSNKKVIGREIDKGEEPENVQEECDETFKRRVDRVEALVICFVLVLRNKQLRRKQ